MKKNNLAIQLIGVSKKYTVHHEKPTLVHNFFKKNQEFWALKKVNLKIEKGEKIGIIGDNGSGKTTLLKIINGITSPTVGKVKTYGKVVSLIDLEAGFHPDLTGEENIFLNGMLLGMDKKEIQSNFKNIIRFAAIGDFIDARLHTYSQGMKLRLGFTIAAHSNPDILILDEMLSVGDQDFQKKSSAKIQEFFKQGKTIVIVSHWLDFIRKSCDRAVLLDQGKLVLDNKPSVVIRKYKTS